MKLEIFSKQTNVSMDAKLKYDMHTKQLLEGKKKKKKCWCLRVKVNMTIYWVVLELNVTSLALINKSTIPSYLLTVNNRHLKTMTRLALQGMCLHDKLQMSSTLH